MRWMWMAGCAPGLAFATEATIEVGQDCFDLDAGAVDAAADVGPVAPACANDIDDDGDGAVDLADPGCVGPEDDDEADPDPLPACGNGLDDDEDGLTDYPSDPDCLAAGGDSEGAICGPDRRLVELMPGIPTAVLLPNADPVAQSNRLMILARATESARTPQAAIAVADRALALDIDDAMREAIQGYRQGLVWLTE